MKGKKVLVFGAGVSGVAAARLAARGESGCKTVLDIPPAMLSPQSAEELRRKLL